MASTSTRCTTTSRPRPAGWKPAAAILLLLSAAAPAAAQERNEPFAGLYGVSAGLGLADPKGLSSTLALMGRMDLGRVIGISILPTVEYWGKSDRALGVKVSSHDLTLGGDARVRLSHGLTRPYLGAGLAMHFVNAKTEQDGRTESRNSEKVGAALLAGLEFERSESFSWFVEAKYRFVSDLGTWKALAGITYSP